MSLVQKIRVFCWGSTTPTDKDLVLLTPFHLFQKYRQMPLSMVLHFFIVVFLSFQALLLSGEYIGYGRANERSFEAIFLPLGIREKGIYNIPDTVRLIGDIVNNYYKFPAVSVGRYAHLLINDDNDGTASVTPVLLSITQYQNLSGSFWQLPCPDANITHHSPIDEHYDGSSDDIGISHSGYEYSITKVFGELSNFELNGDFSSDDIDGDYSTIVTEYNLTISDPLGPFSKTLTSCALQELFYSIQEIRLSFSYRAVNIGNLAVLPYYWDIEILLTAEAGQITPSIIIAHRIISIAATSTIFVILNSILFLSSIISGILSVHSVGQNIRIFLRTKARYQYFQRVARPGDPYPSWSSIPFYVKPLFFDLWSIFNAVGCVIIMISCLTGLLEQYGKDTSAIYMALYGLGCMLACINVLRYFEYFNSLYLHVLTLRNASMHVITYCISVLPIYWAFAIFGVLNYGPYSEKFNSIGHTLVTLFSLLNGDDIYGTFTEIEDGQYPLTIVSRIYIFSFVTLFVTSVLNVFIFIIEDSYRTAKLYSRSPEENLLDNHQSLHNTTKTSNEILALIFQNLEIWQERMEKHIPFDFNDFQLDHSLDQKDQSDHQSETESDDDREEEFLVNKPPPPPSPPPRKSSTRFHIARTTPFPRKLSTPNDSSTLHPPERVSTVRNAHSHDDIYVESEQLKEFSNATYDEKSEDAEPVLIKLEEVGGDSSRLTVPVLRRKRHSGDLTDLSDPGKLLDLLQNQLIAQRKQFDIELEKREREIRELKLLYDNQNTAMMHLFGSLKENFKRK